MEGYGKNSGGKGIHVDNPQRLISILFYLGGYNKIEGGEHRLWKKNDSGDLEIHEIIRPEKNLIVAGFGRTGRNLLLGRFPVRLRLL